ncbi:hypothetical protein E4U30_000741 [Claviceps sp. LM220 group G6]|nr:hypothetical protein E4U30_000741 [Claviceps sp. LM220 group G6]
MKTSLVLSTIIGAGLAAAAECPAPGFSDSQGRYSCNPAHQYPEGQQCKEIDGCLFLTDASGKPVINKTTSSGAAQPTSACPAPGSSDSQGRYSCNPAHQYPEGQQCKEIDGCLFLCDASGKPVISKPTSVVTSGAAQPTSACPAPGSTDSQGRYSCNPAHQYPEGQQCKEIDGCLFLCDANGHPATSQPASSGTGPDMPAGSSGAGSGTGPDVPVVTAGAAALSGAGLLGFVGLAIALF